VATPALAEHERPGWLAWVLATLIVESTAGLVSSRVKKRPFRRAIAVGATMGVRPVAQWLADVFGI
jgi:hypothetical protein